MGLDDPDAVSELEEGPLKRAILQSNTRKFPMQHPLMWMKMTGVTEEEIAQQGSYIAEWFHKKVVEEGMPVEACLTALVGRYIQIGYRLKELEDEQPGHD